MEQVIIEECTDTSSYEREIKKTSDRLMNGFLIGYFIVGLIFAYFNDTWFIAIGVGTLSLVGYYVTKWALPESQLYQYVLSVVFGIFMAQYIYQMHGMFEMHFVAFISSALLITYQKWQLQIPLLIVVTVHHAVFGFLQNIGFDEVYFTQLEYLPLQTFIIHIIFAAVIFFVCGLWAYQLKNYGRSQMTAISSLRKTECELRIANQKAEESVKAKSDFLANMSHEIRTPIHGITGMIELTLETDLSMEQKRYLNTVKFSSETLLGLINDILDFSKIDAGMLDFSPVPFSLRDEIPKALQPLGLKASHKDIELIFDVATEVPDLFIADVLRVRQVITNLVGNAIKFTDKGHIKVSVSLKRLLDHKAELLFCVSDTGIGIPADKLGIVFEKFSQADSSTTRKYGGTGLGLTITKTLVEKMGGDVWVTSEEGKGSHFFFSIPMDVQENGHGIPKLEYDEWKDAGVLIVEDHKESRDNLLQVISQFGLTPTAVSNGEDALMELEKAARKGTPFSILLLDIVLSGDMDGFDVAETVQAHPQFSDTDIIIISKSQKASDRERFGQIGITHFFSKPFSQRDLLECMETLLLQKYNGFKTENQPASLPAKMSLEEAVFSDQLKILLVEDNIVNQEVALCMLKKRSHQVSVANNGEEAVHILTHESFDVVLMDVQMPKMNGYEATIKIRQMEAATGEHVMIIGLTASNMKGDKEKCLEAGMDDFISKPMRMKELIQALTAVGERKV